MFLTRSCCQIVSGFRCGAARVRRSLQILGTTLLLVTVSIPALASTVIEAPRTLSSISVRGDHAVLFFSPALAIPPENCGGVNATIAVVVDVNPSTGDKALFSAALAAFHSGYTVGFVVQGCGPDDLARAIQINVQP